MKKSCLLFILLFACLLSFSQDPQFLNTNQSLINLNPSFAGSNGGIRNQLSYNLQQPSEKSASNLGKRVSYLNSADAYLKPLGGGLSVSVLFDNQSGGLIKVNSYALGYAQYLSVSGGNLKIIPSVQFGYAFRHAAPNPENYIDRGTGVVTTVIPEETQKNYVDLNSGIVVTYKTKLYFGVSFHHINQPDIGAYEEDKMPRLFNMYLSYNWFISEQTHLQFFYRYQEQHKYSTNQLGMNIIFFNHAIAGLGFSPGENIMMNFGYRHNYFNVVLVYGLMNNDVLPGTYNSWEMHASFNLRNKEQRKVLTSFESW